MIRKNLLVPRRSSGWRTYGAIGLLVSLLVVGSVVLFGCGQQGGSGGSSSTQGKITGTAVVSQSDLTKLGMTVANVSSSSVNRVSQLVTAAVVQPMALSSGTATLCTMDASGVFISTGVSANLASDGTYAFNFTPTAGTLYYVKIAKTNAGKELIMYAPAYMATATSEVTAESSVTTTMVVEIVAALVEELKNKNIDPQVIDVIKEYMFKVITDMVASGDIKVPSLVTASGAENKELKKIVQSLMDAAASKDMIKAMKLNLMMEKGRTSQAAARAFIREVFSIIAGGPDNIPGTAVEALGDAYYAGRTQTVAQIIAAINSAGLDNSGNPTTLSLNADTVAASINTSLTDLYNNLSNKSGSVPPIVLAVFPPAEKNTLLPVTSSTVFKVPQVMLVVQKIMDGQQAAFDPFKMMQNMGVYTPEAGVQIMHSEIRVVNYRVWGTRESDAVDTQVLSSYVDVYSSQGNTALAGTQVSLTYPDTNGVNKTVGYTEESQAMMGPKIGKMFKIAPWGAPGEAQIISDFKKSDTFNCTIVATAGASTVTKAVTVRYINMASAIPTLQVPKASWDDLTEIAAGTQPVFSWIEPTVTLPSGYVLRYALEVSKVTGQQGGQMTWTYNSWERQEFIAGNSFTLPATAALEANERYFLGLRALAVEEETNRPVVEGTFVGGMFIVKNATDMTDASASYDLSGTITSNASDTKLKVGLFKVNETIFSAGTTIAPTKTGTISGTSFTINWTPGALSSLRGYGIEVIAWNDENDDGNLLVGGSGSYGEPAAFSRKHIGYWGGILSVWDENLGKDYPLKDSLTNFNCDLTFGGARTASVKPLNVFSAARSSKEQTVKLLNQPFIPLPVEK